MLAWFRLLLIGESRILESLRHLKYSISRIETIVASNQDKLNALSDQLGTATDGLRADIEELKNQPGAEVLDFTALDERVAALSALDAENVPAPPVDPALG